MAQYLLKEDGFLFTLEDDSGFIILEDDWGDVDTAPPTEGWSSVTGGAGSWTEIPEPDDEDWTEV